MSYEGEGEIWIENLTVSSEQSSEERHKANHDHPVRHTRGGEIEHLGMAKNFS